MKRTPVLLVSMPWEDLEYPSIQLGILLPLLRNAGINTHARSLKFDFMEQSIAATAGLPPGERLGVDSYRKIVDWSRGVSVGDWVFAVPPFRPIDPSLDEEYFAFLRSFSIPEEHIEAARRFRQVAPSFLQWCADDILGAQPRIVGFTSAFNQGVASLALARMLKARRPDITIVFGGANCQGPMGETLLRTFPDVDVVVRGEAELVLPPLVRDLLAGGPIRPRPGLCFRQGGEAIVVDEAAEPRVAMDEVPLPSYDEYFDRLQGASFAADLEPDVTLFYEGARGCWWGQKSQCTFCGISSLAMPFRSKSPDRVVREIFELARRYQRLDFLIVDYIMDLRYLSEVLPRLRDAGCDLRLFFEMKANLRREHVRLLRESGVVWMQAGVESLSTPILRLMKKGVTALQNIRLLKWCVEYGVLIHWNLLYGFPHEPEDEYARMADLLRSLTHLEPPRMIRLQLDRFSPYHERPRESGLEVIGPRRDYRFIYPLPDETIADLVYSFEHRHLDGRDPEAYTGEMRRVIESWREHGHDAVGTLSWRRGPGFLVVTDRRPGLAPAEYRFDEIEAALYLACDDGATAAAARAAVGEQGIDVDLDGTIAFLNDLVSARLMYEEGGCYLALAVPALKSLRARPSPSENAAFAPAASVALVDAAPS